MNYLTAKYNELMSPIGQKSAAREEMQQALVREQEQQQIADQSSTPKEYTDEQKQEYQDYVKGRIGRDSIAFDTIDEYFNAGKQKPDDTGGKFGDFDYDPNVNNGLPTNAPILNNNTTQDNLMQATQRDNAIRMAELQKTEEMRRLELERAGGILPLPTDGTTPEYNQQEIKSTGAILGAKLNPTQNPSLMTPQNTYTPSAYNPYYNPFSIQNYLQGQAKQQAKYTQAYGTQTKPTPKPTAGYKNLGSKYYGY